MNKIEQNKKIRLSSWIFAAIYMTSGIVLFLIIPGFRTMFQEQNLSLPSLSSLIFSVKPLVWLVLSCILAILSLIRDISGKIAFFSNWVAVLVLLIMYFVIVIPLFLPMFYEVSKYN